MPRPSRKKIKFDEDSANYLAQEIYNETHNINAQIAALFTKWSGKVKDEGQIAQLGDQVIKLIEKKQKNQDQKLALLRYIKEVAYINSVKKNGSDDEVNEISNQTRDELYRLIEQSNQSK